MEIPVDDYTCILWTECLWSESAVFCVFSTAHWEYPVLKIILAIIVAGVKYCSCILYWHVLYLGKQDGVVVTVLALGLHGLRFES